MARLSSSTRRAEVVNGLRLALPDDGARRSRRANRSSPYSRRIRVEVVDVVGVEDLGRGEPLRSGPSACPAARPARRRSRARPRPAAATRRRGRTGRRRPWAGRGRRGPRAARRTPRAPGEAGRRRRPAAPRRARAPRGRGRCRRPARPGRPPAAPRCGRPCPGCRRRNTAPGRWQRRREQLQDAVAQDGHVPLRGAPACAMGRCPSCGSVRVVRGGRAGWGWCVRGWGGPCRQVSNRSAGAARHRGRCAGTRSGWRPGRRGRERPRRVVHRVRGDPGSPPRPARRRPARWSRGRRSTRSCPRPRPGCRRRSRRSRGRGRRTRADRPGW